MKLSSRLTQQFICLILSPEILPRGFLVNILETNHEAIALHSQDIKMWFITYFNSLFQLNHRAPPAPSPRVRVHKSDFSSASRTTLARTGRRRGALTASERGVHRWRRQIQ